MSGTVGDDVEYQASVQGAAALAELETWCESPIEVMFLRALVKAADGLGLPLWGTVGSEVPPPMAFPLTDHEAARQFQVRVQPHLDPFRADFMLQVLLGDKGETVVVECDGHDFHERTKDQAARDRRRDRTIQGWGASIFRFTGSEIHHDALGCARACFDHLDFQISG